MLKYLNSINFAITTLPHHIHKPSVGHRKVENKKLPYNMISNPDYAWDVSIE